MKPCSCRHVPFLETEKLNVYRKIVFGIVTGRIEHNVLELCLVRFETVVYRNALNNDTMFNRLLQRKNKCLSRSDLVCKSFDVRPH